MTRAALPLLILAAVPVSLSAADASGVKPPPEGFVALFDGKSLTGWKDAEKQAAHWKIEDGVLHYDGKGKDLVTERNYKDFEMWVDWKITPKGDSGIYLRGMPQVQIWDNPEGSGTLWNNPKGAPGKLPLVVADNKVGEWNTFYIKMVGKNVTVKLNDKLVVDNALFDPQYGKKIVPDEGPIWLQHHGTELWFRNVYIKELPAK